MSKKINRRQFIQTTAYGTSVSLLLPWLPSLAPRSAWANTGTGNKNLVVMYMPDGTFVHRIQGNSVVKDGSFAEWQPTPGAFGATLPSMLKPLEGNRDDFSLISGIRTYTRGRCDAGHGTAMGAYLTAINWNNNLCQKSNTHAPNESVDQQVARHLAGQGNIDDISTVIKMANSGNIGERDKINVGIWGHNISFRGGAAAPSVLDPSALFRRLFSGGFGGQGGDPARRIKYKKTLDVLVPEIKAKLSKASPSDRIVLNRFLASYEGIASDLTAMEQEQQMPVQTQPTTGPSCTFTTQPSGDLSFRDDAGFYDKYDERINLYVRMMAAAMACGSQRVFSLLLESEAAGRSGRYGRVIPSSLYHSAGGYTANRNDLDGDPHIGMAHYEDGPGGDYNTIKKIVLLTTVTHYRLSKFKMLIDEAKRMGVFNDSLFTIGHSIADGQKHSMIDPPLLVAGGAGGLRRGQHIKLDSNPRNTIYAEGNTIPMAEFWRSVKKVYGMNSDSGRADAAFSNIG